MGALNKEIPELQKNLKTTLPILEATKKKLAAGVKMTPDQVKQVQALAVNVKATQEKLIADNTEMESLKEKLEEGSAASVDVMGEAYQGVVITISDVSMVIKETVRYCRFIKDKGDVRIASM
jgi:uncharacterized protein (DUF342 family)